MGNPAGRSQAGWATLISLVSTKDDEQLDLAALKKLLARARKTIYQAPDVVRSKMNGFVIALGSFVAPLLSLALRIGEAIGPVTVDVGDTACKVPFAPEYIRRVEQRGGIGKNARQPNASLADERMDGCIYYCRGLVPWRGVR